ncbi:DHA2 family efflux MFS transporter permease subunit [Mycobacterium angelicum]|uniref:MFS transporter n=1 Tax=Mycobacterium angelicum TaxID=470074 RepID=A0A1W9ZSU3_MYCAN|nr:DHA2 family efflux MFS transporter permease subunit [Mycobacterium angelicum]MCV7200372.1 DHA2 family efflux MFS transporter permease subunit [Mycobacterium angelicum]ORA20867.1 MFS transporter [Mycobacterium angelicum]
MEHGALDSQPPEALDQLDARLLRIAGVCVLGSMMPIVDTTVVTVAQRTFVAAFETTQAVVAWTMTGYTLAMAAVIPLTGWAADRFGTKRLFMGSLAAFTVGSLLCALAPNIGLLIAFRVAQGLGGGMLMPLVLTILTREAGPKRLGRIMAVLGVPVLLGPIFGPVLGGWLIDSYGWEWIFWINLPIGLVAVVLAAIVFPKDHSAPSETFDLVGMLLLCPGLAIFLYGISVVPSRGTVADRHVWVPVLTGLVLIIGFLVHALYRAEHPLIDLRLLNNRAVTLANAAMFFFAASFFGAGLLFPSYFQELLHQTPLNAGMSMVPRGIGAMLTMPLAGSLMDKRGPARILMAGITLIAIGMCIFSYGVAKQAHYVPTLLPGLTIMGLGMGCTMMPLSAAAVQSLAPHQIARGSTLVNVNQQVAASVGTALMSVILTSQFNRSENISAAKKIAVLQEDSARRGVPVDPSSMPARALDPEFPGNLMRDLSHAYTAVFLVAVALIALTFIPVALLPKRSAGQVSTPAAGPTG